jgi:hypothetical protein
MANIDLTTLYAATLHDEDGTFVWSRHLTFDGARAKCITKITEIVKPELGGWSVYVQNPDGIRVWVAGDPLRERLIVRAQ